MKPAAGRLVRAFWNVMAAIGLSIVIITFTPLVSWWARALAGPWNDPQGEVLVVLGGSLQSPGVIGQSSYLRSVYASFAFREGTFREVVVSGGSRTGPPLAALMGDYLRYAGVPAARLHLEDRSLSTRENALFSRALVNAFPGRKVLMTSDFHMTRARRAFERAGVVVEPRPIPDALKRAESWRLRLEVLWDLARESAALAYYYARGWI